MPTGAELFAAPAAAPEAASTVAPGVITGASLFGGPSAQEQETSPLARNRAALPKAAQEKTGPSSATETVGAPSPADIQRNATDLGRGGGPGDIENKLRRFFGAPEVGKDKKFETVLEADMPFPELPVVVSGKALVKAGTSLVTAITNKAAGVSQLFSGSAKLGSTVGDLSNDFFTTTRMVYQRRAEWLKDITNFMPKNWSQMAAKVDDFLEGTAAGPLSKEEQKMATNIRLMNAKTAKMREQVRGFGYDVGPDEPGYIGSRLAVDKPSLLNSLISSAPTGKAKSISAFAPEFKPRIVHGLEGGGEKNLHLIDNGNGTFTVWRNKEKITGGKFDAEELARGEVSIKTPSSQKAGYGAETEKTQTFKIVPSTKRAIEEHTNVQYYHDPLLSAITANMHVSEALNAAQFLEKLKFSPELQASRVAPGTKVFPEGWRGVDVPQLKGYKFDPKIADVIDDFALPARTGGFKQLNDLSRAMVGSMFWNPLPHAFNVNAFGALETGMIGAAKQLGHPVEFVQSMLKAHRDVMNLTPAYREAVRAGAGLQYNAIFARDFVGKMARQLGADPEMNAAAKAWGYANPAHMWKRVMDESAKHLWSWNDTILMHAYHARMEKGASLPEAIKDVESIIPNYRAPSRILGSREVAQAWQVLPTFARYHWGVLKAYGTIANGLMAGNAQEKMKALDRMAMLALGSTVIYPALDQAIRSATGNEEARLRRFGPFSIPDAIYRFSVGDARYASLSSAILGLSPVFSVPTALAMGADPFTGKKFQNMQDVMHFIEDQINPIQTITSYEGLGGRKTGGELLMEQLGVQLPSEAETNARDKARAREEKRREKEEE